MATLKVTRVKAGFRATVRGPSGEEHATADNKTKAICEALRLAKEALIITQGEREHFLIYGRWPIAPRSPRAPNP